jgi:hypothetical protein
MVHRLADDPPERRTDAEIQALKDAWIDEHDYDIEDAEGFDAHYQELREWRLGWEDERIVIRFARTAKRAEMLGFTSLQMAYFEGIEQDIAHMGRDIASLVAAATRD